MVVQEGRSRDATGGLPAGRGRRRGQHPDEVSGSDARQPLDLRRSLRASGTVHRGYSQRPSTSAASARRRVAPAVRRGGAIEVPVRFSDLGGL